MHLGPHLGPQRGPELLVVLQKMQKIHFFQDFGSEGPQMGPQIFFSKGNYYDTSFLIHVRAPFGAPRFYGQKKSFFLAFLVEQGISSSQNRDEWGPGRGPEILQFASMTSQLSLEKN